MIKFTKLKIFNYRIFGEEGVEISNPSKINLFIGKNNCGKTNVLKFMTLIGQPSVYNRFRDFDRLVENPSIINSPSSNLNHRHYKSSIPLSFAVYCKPSETFLSQIVHSISVDDFYVRYDIIMLPAPNQEYSAKVKETFIDKLGEEIVVKFWTDEMKRRGSLFNGNYPTALMNFYSHIKPNKEIELPTVHYIDCYRKPVDNNELRIRLDNIVNPTYDKQENLEKKRMLCEYIKSVFDIDKRIDIVMPDKNREIEIEIDGRRWAMTSLGAGIQQMVNLAFEIITSEAQLICVDEPELHMHPGAQRAFLDLISKIEDKSFFFATHSNHFLDYEIEGKKLYRVSMDNGESKIEELEDSIKIRETLNELGIRASEIYQTNGIIWVEGASDRIYIKKWLELLHPELKEGLQYSFQYYGGKVLSHYSIDDEEYEEYLNMLVINKNAFIVIDSDRDKDYKIEDLRDTKQRVISECNNHGVRYWITKGKEVENYITKRTMFEHSGDDVTVDIYKPMIDYYDKYTPKKKVPFAHSIVDKIKLEDLENYDLKEKINEVAQSIKDWNS